MFSRVRRAFGFGRMSEAEYRKQRDRILQHSPIAFFWLFGRTGSGKTSIVKYLTGAEEADIGNGFRPQTSHSRQYDFPSVEDPLIRFLDTRGLSEGHYDPAEDIARFDDSTHVMIVTVRVTDHAVEDVVRPLRQLRRSRRQRPVLLALTCLHQAIPEMQLPSPDPFADPAVGQLPDDLRRCIDTQQRRFAGLVDRVVPIDLTRPEEGFREPNFGGDRLKAALIDLLPAAYRQTLLMLDQAMSPLRNLNDRRAMPYVVSYSMMAAGAAAIPIPWVDIPVVLAIQSRLIYQLADVYGQRVGAAALANMAGGVGMRIVARLAVGETAKLIPYLGMAANASLAFAYTFGLGKACCWYFGEIRLGNAPTSEQLAEVWHEQITRAATLWRQQSKEPMP